MENAIMLLGVLTFLVAGVGIVVILDKLIYFATGRSVLDAIDRLLGKMK